MAEENKNSIFRKKSLDRISTPEELDNYLVVTGPGVWLPLIGAAVLLIGLLVWMALGNLTTALNVAVVSSGGETLCLVPAEQAEAAVGCGVITIAEQQYPLLDSGRAAVMVTEEFDASIRMAGGLAENTLVMPLTVAGTLADGVYEGEIIIEVIHPIKFILN